MRERTYLSGKGNKALWFGLFGPPAIWLLTQGLAYVVVPRACSNDQTIALHLIMLSALALVGLAGYTSLDIWRGVGLRLSKDDSSPEDRTRFISELALGGGALFGVIILGQWVAITILGPCIPLPRVPFTPDAMMITEPLLRAHVGVALAPHDLWGAWDSNPLIVLSLLWGTAFYAAGFSNAPRRLRLRAAAFGTGIVCLVIALLSPLHALSEALFSAHMAQHTLLIAVAAPLLVFGRPMLISLWALPRARRIAVAAHPATRAIAHSARLAPGQTFVLHAVTIWVWHAPWLYEAALSNPFVHALQHMSFLTTAVAFWYSLLAVRDRSNSYGAGVFYVFATGVHTSVLGALMTLAEQPWYEHYAEATGAWGLTPLDDQQLAGLIMWVPAGLLYTVAALLLLAAWLRESQRRGRRARWTTTVVVSG